MLRVDEMNVNFDIHATGQDISARLGCLHAVSKTAHCNDAQLLAVEWHDTCVRHGCLSPETKCGGLDHSAMF